MDATSKINQPNEIEPDLNLSEDMILSAIVEGSTDGIIRVDDHSRIVSWTPGAERILGYTREEIVGEPIDSIVPPELREDVRESMQAQMNGDMGVLHTETMRLTKSGKLVHVQLTRIPLKDNSGKTVALLAIFKDISEQKKLQKEKKQLKSEQIELQKKLEVLQRNTAMARVAAKVAHEIRTPLGVLFLKSDLLMERLDQAFENWGKGDPQIHRKPLDKCLADIQRQISRLEEIANNYLHLSKSRSMERQEVDIRRFIEELTSELQEQQIAHNVKLDVSISGDLGRGYFDPQQFQRVFANLVRNSIEALNHSQTENGHIEIRARRLENCFEFQVIDNGPGIPDEIRETVFDPFTTTKSIGTGLGLYLACEIVENHGGTIQIDSRPGGGTIIHITIPIEEK